MMQRHNPEDLNLQQPYSGNLKCGKHLDIPAENTRAPVCAVLLVVLTL
jgi:hypothetical protein